jgi:hypothetical protein
MSKNIYIYNKFLADLNEKNNNGREHVLDLIKTNKLWFLKKRIGVKALEKISDIIFTCFKIFIRTIIKTILLIII